jgi:predicted TIM-barrel enzyme
MYGDATRVRALAVRLRTQADDIRVEAAELERLVARTPWTGMAADAMRAFARVQARDLLVCADLHDEAAEALERHAREVDRVKDLISGTEHRVLALVDATASRVQRVVSHAVPNRLERWAVAFAAPPHGSIEWLDVHVPDLW